MNKFQKSALALSTMMCFVASAEAASLGQLTVTSHANQNFQATFLVHDVAPNGTSLSARLAPEDVYRQYNITMPETAKGLSLALINKSPLTLKISAHSPAKERAFPLLVELNEGGKKTVRQYNIHLGATGTVEPVAVGGARVGAESSRPASVVKEPEPLTKEMPKVGTTKLVAPKVDAEPTPLERMQSHNYNLDRTLVVEQGYTPWSLGVLYQKRYPQASVNQVLVALAIQNPEAFPAGNVRQLKTGAKITAPSKNLVMSIDRKAAQEIVQKGLSIEEVASRPMPIAAASKPITTAKAATNLAPKNEIKPNKAEISDAKKPLASAEEKNVTTEVQPQPQPQAQPQVEAKKVDNQAPVSPQVEEPVQKEPVLKNGIPVAEAPHHDGSAKLEPLESTLPQEPLTETAGVENAQAPEVAPTLEIMTEEEEIVEEESTGWYWYVLILLLLGGAGFLYWNTKQGGRVNLNSLKNLMADKLPLGQPVTKTEPKPMRSEPTIETPKQESVETGQTLQEVTPEPVVKAEPAPVVPPQVTPTVTEPKNVEEKPKAKAEEEETTNIFDLLGDNAAETIDATAQRSKSMMESQSMKDSLDMARSFISIGAKKEAFELLQQVAAGGTAEEKAMAEMFMNQIREQQ